jgi:hypothetical protein
VKVTMNPSRSGVEIEPPQQLAVEGQTVRIEGVGGAEDPPEGGLGGGDFAPQLTVGERPVADEVDRNDLGLGALVDLEHEIHPVLGQLDDRGIHGRREPALAPIDRDHLGRRPVPSSG